MAEHPIVIVGAGASMPYRAPGLRGILQDAFESKPDALADMDQFLQEQFRSVGPDRVYPELPVVLMSGHSESDLGRRVAGYTDVECVHKPFTTTALASRFRRIPGLRASG